MVFHALFFVKLATSKVKQVCVFDLFVVHFAGAVLEFDFVAADHRDELLGFDLFFEFLEVEVLINKYLYANHTFILKSHHASSAIVDNEVSTGDYFEVLILLLLNFINFVCYRFKNCLRGRTASQNILLRILVNHKSGSF